MFGLYGIPVQLRAFAMTIETTYTQAREQLKALMDRAVDDREVIVVRRRSGDAVAMIAADELQKPIGNRPPATFAQERRASARSAGQGAFRGFAADVGFGPNRACRY
jgi:hypothetical protein